MLDLRRLAQTFVIDATDQGHSVAVIESAVEEFLAPLRAKEERCRSGRDGHHGDTRL